MSKLSHEEMARAVASGKHVYNYDQAIGALVLLGFIFFPLAPQSAIIGLPLLILFIWARKSELRG